MSNNILVPIDFTDVSSAALRTAISLQKKKGSALHLIHVLEGNADEESTREKFAKLLAEHSLAIGPRLELHLPKGSLYTEIAAISQSIHAMIVVMGTHGMHGFQKVFGSHALKVITSCNAPFLIVQKEVSELNIERIVVPFDLTKKSLTILNSAAAMSEWFGAEVMLIGGKQSDESLAIKSRNNITNARTILGNHKIKHRVALLPRQRHFDEEVMRYAEENDAQMIAVGYHSTSMFPFFDTFVQHLLTNHASMPVLVVDAEKLSSFISSARF